MASQGRGEDVGDLRARACPTADRRCESLGSELLRLPAPMPPPPAAHFRGQDVYAGDGRVSGFPVDNGRILAADRYIAGIMETGFDSRVDCEAGGRRSCRPRGRVRLPRPQRSDPEGVAVACGCGRRRDRRDPAVFRMPKILIAGHRAEILQLSAPVGDQQGCGGVAGTVDERFWERRHRVPVGGRVGGGAPGLGGGGLRFRQRPFGRDRRPGFGGVVAKTGRHHGGGAGADGGPAPDRQDRPGQAGADPPAPRLVHPQARTYEMTTTHARKGRPTMTTTHPRDGNHGTARRRRWRAILARAAILALPAAAALAGEAGSPPADALPEAAGAAPARVTARVPVATAMPLISGCVACTTVSKAYWASKWNADQSARHSGDNKTRWLYQSLIMPRKMALSLRKIEKEN